MQRGARVIAIILLLIATGFTFYHLGALKAYHEVLDDLEELTKQSKEGNHE